MYVVMGGNGHVGSATASALLDLGEPVTVLVRDVHAAEPLRRRGAAVVVADATDVEAMRRAFRSGRRALLVNPPADPAGDTDAAEHRTVDAVLSALDGSGLEKVVAVSTYGVRPGDGIGDLGTLSRLEVGLAEQDVPAAVDRHAYAMTNWDGLVPAVLDTGVLTSVLPPGLRLPMVAPADLGAVAAARLRSGPGDVGVVHVEGPERYSVDDVAEVLADLRGRAVSVETTPLDTLEQTFADSGFSAVAAASYAAMTRSTIEDLDLPADPVRGRVSLRDHFASLLGRRVPGPPER